MNAEHPAPATGTADSFGDSRPDMSNATVREDVAMTGRSAIRGRANSTARRRPSRWPALPPDSPRPMDGECSRQRIDSPAYQEDD
jgi:hypothetical protein